MSIWDETVGSTAPQDKTVPPEVTDRLEELMKEFKTTNALVDGLKEKLSVIRDEILDHFPNEPGQYQQVSRSGGHLLEVRVLEKWTWDETKLESLLADTSEVPYFVKRKHSVDRRKFERLEPEEKDAWLDALTREPGLARVSVKAIHEKPPANKE